MSADWSWLHKLFWAAWLPGMLYWWSRAGLRGQSWRRFLLESLLTGFVGAGVAWLSLVLADKFVFGLQGEEAFVGAMVYLTKGWSDFVMSPYWPATVSFVAGYYLAMFFAGYFLRAAEAKRSRLSVRAESALDVHMRHLRGQGAVPLVTVRTRGGKEITGRCRIYTFTEPREILLELKDDEEQRCVWLRLENAAEVEVAVSAEENRQREKVVKIPV